MSTINTILSCSNCGGHLDVDDTKRIVKCPFCGTYHSVADLLRDSEEVKIERIRRDVELGRQNLEAERLQQQREAEQRQQEINRLNEFKNGRILKFLIGLTIVSVLLCFVFFGTGRVLSGVITVVIAALSLTSILMGMQVIKEKFNRMHILPMIGALILIVPTLGNIGVSVRSSKHPLTFSATEQNKTEPLYKPFLWDDMVLSQELPKPPSEVGIISKNTKGLLSMEVYQVTIKQYYDFVEQCKQFGYTIDADEDDTSFKAFNLDGYELYTYFREYGDNYLSISLEAPEEMGEYEWTDSYITDKLPKPESQIGNITWDSSTNFAIHLGDTTIEQYNAYVDKCIEKGFDVEHSRGEKSYSAYDSEGFQLNVDYKGNNVMNIYIKSPENWDGSTSSTSLIESIIDGIFNPDVSGTESTSGSLSESVSEPEESSIPEENSSVPQASTIYTTENCEDLQALIYCDRVADESTIKSFANSYKGKTIELELLTAFVENYKDYSTRFNYLLYAVEDDLVMLAGPAFMFENVSPVGLNYIGSNIPDSFGEGIHCRVKAKVDGYKNEMIMLKLDTIEVITVY